MIYIKYYNITLIIINTIILTVTLSIECINNKLQLPFIYLISIGLTLNYTEEQKVQFEIENKANYKYIIVNKRQDIFQMEWKWRTFHRLVET